MTSWSLRVWSRFLCPPADVWALKTDPEALRHEFAPFLAFRMSDADRTQMINCLSDRRGPAEVEAMLLPMGVRWPMMLQLITPGAHYRDSSKNRIYTDWVHDHVLSPASDGCLYLDEVRFRTPSYGGAALASLTQRLLKHRHRVAAQWLPCEDGTVGISVLRLDSPPRVG